MQPTNFRNICWHLRKKLTGRQTDLWKFCTRSLGLHRLVAAEHPFDLRGEMSIFLVDKRGTWSAMLDLTLTDPTFFSHVFGHDDHLSGATQSWCYPWRSDDVDGRRRWYLLGGGSRSQHRGSLLFSKFWWKRAFHWCSQGRELWGCGLTGEWLMPRKSIEKQKRQFQEACLDWTIFSRWRCMRNSFSLNNHRTPTDVMKEIEKACSPTELGATNLFAFLWGDFLRC